MQSEHEIFSNSTEKRLDDEIRQVENENAGFERSGNSFSPEYYSDGFDSDKNDDATKIFDNSGLKAAAEYAPYAPEDIDEYGNERANKHRKAYIVIVVCASVLILAIIVLAAILLGKNCGGTSTPAMSSSMISEPTARKKSRFPTS